MSSDADAALVAAASAAGYRLTLLDGDTPEAPTPLVVRCAGGRLRFRSAER
jgi:hypothetical protein